MFYDALVKLIESQIKQADMAKELNTFIIQNNSEEIVMKRYLYWLEYNCK